MFGGGGSSAVRVDKAKGLRTEMAILSPGVESRGSAAQRTMTMVGLRLELWESFRSGAIGLDLK